MAYNTGLSDRFNAVMEYMDCLNEFGKKAAKDSEYMRGYVDGIARACKEIHDRETYPNRLVYNNPESCARFISLARDALREDEDIVKALEYLSMASGAISER